jgi:hypothetical protein
MDRLVTMGRERLERQLDVRSLITTQNILLSMLKLMVESPTNRQLMRIQRKHKVLEPNANLSGDDSSEDEGYMATSHKREAKLLLMLQQMDHEALNNNRGVDPQTKKILSTVLRVTHKSKSLVRVTPDMGSGH